MHHGLCLRRRGGLFYLRGRDQAFERETPFRCSEIRLELNIHGVGPFMIFLLCNWATLPFLISH